ncbi:alkaline phosphatase family protein [Dietzia psychralcaliphila]|uniref:Phosphodiesterase n=1 Tax=Dietzia psychralcaliphila TaxID=139021 RepID=A0AAD0NNC6_9ACTN|nr:alkaline phosphatase family protein [Dietzia psychralcaliphila]AWH95576.1 phosphodiesterase [Dietzia psychralcaliphila]PTM88675.1 putative AlkP superfamily pyrophosphatase or phosphodiesterase [Dietzia psychralcaliphila]
MSRHHDPCHGPTLTRREALAGAGMVAAAGAVGVTLLADPAPVWANPTRPVADDLDVYVLVTDGMRPDELTPVQAPTLHRWASEGTRFTHASSVMIAETLPNHAAMVTGVLPERNGVPANSIWDHAAGTDRTLDRPDDLRAPTVLDRIRTEAGLTTASVLSKDYLHGLFGGRASVQWAPFPLVPITDHSLDWFTIEALKQTVTDHAPRMTFVNLGDMDRFGHMDLSGTSLRLARNQAVANSDHKLWDFEQFLRSTGRWERSVVIVLADHGMDWSEPLSLISAAGAIEADAAILGRFGIAQNGGADTFAYLGPAHERDASLRRLREVVGALPGVNRLYDPTELSLGERGGDLVATCHPGWRFSDPTPFSNPIPGNHGHEVTLGIPFFIGGGHRIVRRGGTVDRPVRTLDVAPTVARLFGLDHAGMDGRPALEAFHI